MINYKENWIFGEFHIAYKKRTPLKIKELPKVTCSRTAYDEFKKFYGENHYTQEIFCVMYLNRSNNVFSIMEISKGNLVGTVVDFQMIFRNAVLLGASGIIVCHNHPSDNPRPSRNDDLIVDKLISIGVLFEIPVVDALIYCDDTFYSYKDEGNPKLNH